jgi:hypothetical protein
MNAKLTGRDVNVLLDVYKCRYLSVSQIKDLHFPSERTAYRRLQVLTSLGYLKAFTVPNIDERVYYLDKPGAEVVAGEFNVTLDSLRWHRYTKVPKDYFFLRHFLSINDFRITLIRACRENPLTLLGFIPEYFGERTVNGHVKKYIRDRVCDVTNQAFEYSHTPDGVFALEKDGRAALFFVEVDRGKEVISDPEKGVLKSIVFYLNYWVNGKWKRFEEDFGREFRTFRTLLVTTSNERLQNIREVVTKYNFAKPEAKRFLWGATHVTKDSLFAPIWQPLDEKDTTLYKIG